MRSKHCIQCENCFNAYTPHGVWVHLCRQAGVSILLTKLKSCPIGREFSEPEEKEHDLTASVLDLYNH